MVISETDGSSTKSMGKKTIFTARFTQDTEHAEKGMC
jgi:hypothetical protein